MGAALLVLLLLAVCGFIAYIGDLLGRRFGKKRLTLFGLRPKHTAIVLTIATGVLIAALTFGTAMAVVPPFRSAVIHGESLGRRNRELSQNIQARTAENQRLEASNRELLQSNTRLKEDSDRLVGANRKLTGDNGRLTQANRGLATQNQTLVQQSATLRDRNSALVQESRALLQNNAELKRKNAAFARTAAVLARRKAELAARNERLEQEQTRLAIQIRDLRTSTSSYRTYDYIYLNGQRIRHRIIPADPPSNVLRATVKALVFDVEEEVRRRKAGALSLVPPLDYTGPSSTAKLQEWVVQKASAIRGKPLVLTVVASANCVPGLPVPVVLDCYPNELAFKKGESIASRVVAGDGTEGAILGALLQFLQTSVRSQASLLIDEAETRIGELSYDQLLEVARRIRKAGGAALVIARARHDTLRAGPLNLDLEVRSVDASRASGG